MIVVEVGFYQVIQGFVVVVGDFVIGGIVDDGVVQVFVEQIVNCFCFVGSDIVFGGGIDQ